MVIRPLSKELQVKANKELNEEPGRIKTDLEYILEWAQKEPHLNIRKDSQWLVAFLRGCKFSLQQTKQKIDYFYTMRTLVPEYFANRDPLLPEVQRILKSGAILPLGKTDGPDGCRVILTRVSACDPETMPVLNMMKVYLMLMDIFMWEDDNSTVAGTFLLVDYSQFSIKYMSQYTPSFLQKTVTCLQNAYPLRIKGICCANAPSFFEMAYNVATTFMNDKLKNRFSLYGEGNLHKVYDRVPQSILPKEYGGDSDTIAEITDKWTKKVENYREWFLEDAKYCSNESLRRGKPKTSAKVFGVEGSFRKLTID